MFFFVNTKHINKYNVSLSKTVTKLCTILTKYFFPYLNPTRCLNTLWDYLYQKLKFHQSQSGNGWYTSDFSTQLAPFFNKEGKESDFE